MVRLRSKSFGVKIYAYQYKMSIPITYDKSLDSKIVSAFRGRGLLNTFLKIFVFVGFLSLENATCLLHYVQLYFWYIH
jgi:hypothetical protein